MGTFSMNFLSLFCFFLCFIPKQEKERFVFFFFFFSFHLLKYLREKKENTKFIRISFHEWLAIATFYNYSFSLLLEFSSLSKISEFDMFDHVPYIIVIYIWLCAPRDSFDKFVNYWVMRKNGLHKNRLPMIDGNLEFSWEFSFQNNNTIVFRMDFTRITLLLAWNTRTKVVSFKRPRWFFSFSLQEGVVCIWVSWFSLLNLLKKIIIIFYLFLFGFWLSFFFW